MDVDKVLINKKQLINFIMKYTIIVKRWFKQLLFIF